MKKYCPLGLTVIAGILLIHGALNAYLVIGGLGLIQGLPLTFFAGLAVLIIASVYLWTLKEPHYILASIQVTILIAALWLIPIFTGGTPQFTDHVYRNIRISNYLGEYGQSWSEGYIRWVGTFLISAGFLKIVNLEAIIRYIPFIIQLLCLIPLYVFLKNSLVKFHWSYCFIGLWLFSIARWVGDSHLTPVSLAILFMLILLALISIIRKYPDRIWLLGLIILTFGFITITHLPTTVIAFFILCSYSIVKKDKKLIIVSIICFLVIVLWDIFVSGYIVGKLSLISQVSASSLNSILADNITIENHTLLLAGTKNHQIVCVLRIILSSIFALIGVFGVIYSVKVSKRFKELLPYICIAVSPLLLLLLGGYYASSIIERVYLYCLPGMAYFGARVLVVYKRRIIAVLLVVILIITIPLHIVSTYGNQAIDYLSDNCIKGIEYTMQMFRQDVESGKRGSPPVLDAFPLSGRNTIEKILNSNDKCIGMYIWLTSRDREWCERILGDVDVYYKCLSIMTVHPVYQLVYSNPDFRLYEDKR